MTPRPVEYPLVESKMIQNHWFVKFGSYHPSQNHLVGGATRHKSDFGEVPSGTKPTSGRCHPAQNWFWGGAIRHKTNFGEVPSGTKTSFGDFHWFSKLIGKPFEISTGEGSTNPLIVALAVYIYIYMCVYIELHKINMFIYQTTDIHV